MYSSSPFFPLAPPISPVYNNSSEKFTVRPAILSLSSLEELQKLFQVRPGLRQIECESLEGKRVPWTVSKQLIEKTELDEHREGI